MRARLAQSETTGKRALLETKVQQRSEQGLIARRHASSLIDAMGPSRHVTARQACDGSGALSGDRKAHPF